MAAELALPPEVFPLFGMTVGREDSTVPSAVKPRLPQRAVSFFEQYGGSRLDQDVADYDAALRRFQEEQGMTLLDWSVKSSERVASPACLKNRDNLKKFLEQMGFGLK